MQSPFSCLPATYSAIENTLSPARLGRYLHAAHGDKQLALRLYVWNARLCESLYFPLQLAEVSSRNAIAIPVQKRFGNQWYSNDKFANILPERHKENLKSTILKEEKKRRQALNQDHIIAGLPFGFWVSLLTNSYKNHLWATGIVKSFPNAGRLDTREEIYKKLDQMRHFRNNVAHHYAIFDRGVQREMQNTLEITKLICLETYWLSGQVSRLSKTINERPAV